MMQHLKTLYLVQVNNSRTYQEYLNAGKTLTTNLTAVANTQEQCHDTLRYDRWLALENWQPV